MKFIQKFLYYDNSKNTSVISFTLLLFLVLILLLSNIQFLLGFSLFWGNTYIATIASVLFLYQFRHTIPMNYLILTGILLIISALCAYFYIDLSYDGRTYHGEQILLMGKESWNPIYQTDRTSFYFIISYPRTFETLAANLYLVTKHYELSKIINFIPLYSMLFLLIEFFKNKIPIILNILFSTMLALSPVVVVQLFTYYVDGVTYSVISCYILIALLNYQYKEILFKYDFLIMKVMIILLSFGIKASLIGYLFILVGADMLLFASHRKAFIKESIVLFSTACVSLFIINFSPYTTNLQAGKHIFHPLMGAEKWDIITPNTPEYWQKMHPLQSFFYSYTSRPENSITGAGSTNVYLPIFDSTAIQTDMRSNGFGMYTFYYLILCLISLIVLSIKWKAHDYKILLYLLVGWSTVLINPASWWARYVPQMWFLMFLSIYYGINLIASTRKKNILISILITTMVINFYGILAFLILRTKETLSVKNSFENIAKAKQTVLIHYNSEKTLKEILERYSINYEIDSTQETLPELWLYKIKK